MAAQDGLEICAPRSGPIAQEGPAAQPGRERPRWDGHLWTAGRLFV